MNLIEKYYLRETNKNISILKDYQRELENDYKLYLKDKINIHHMDEYIRTFHHSSCVKKSDISNHITNSIDNIYILAGGHFKVHFKNGDSLCYDCFSDNHTLETEHFGLELLLSKDKAILSPLSYLDEDIMELDEDIVFDDYYQLSEEQITYIKMRF